jgi:hypothetical protein
MDGSNPSIQSAFDVYHAHVNHTWFFHAWFFSSLAVFSDTPFNEALKRLQTAGLLTGESAQANRDAVAGHQHPDMVAAVLSFLSKKGLLTGESAQANRDAVAGHQDLYKVALALKLLQTVGLLAGESAQANFNAVAEHQNPDKVVVALTFLQTVGLLTEESAQANFNAVAGHQLPDKVAAALHCLPKAGLLTRESAQANRDAVVGHQKLYEVAIAIESLHSDGLLAGASAQANRDAVAGHQDPFGVARTLKTLQTAGLLTGASAQANRDAVAGHQDPFGVALALKLLQTAGLLTGVSAQANRDAVAGHQNPDKVTHALEALQTAGLIAARNEQSQTRFDRLISYSNILCSTETHMLWDRIPTHALTEVHWNSIIQICRANQVNPVVGQLHFTRYVNRELLHINPNQPQALNGGQSTHTASVHQTVSESAIRLNTRYGNNIGDLRAKLKEIEVWVNAQEGHEVEKRGFQQLAHSPYEFVEPTSKITTKMLMALSWTAIHDDSMRMGTLDDAKVLFLEGLFEIQRAYNLNDAFEDRGGQDKAACASGTFNKFIEKLVGVHPDAELKYITKQGAMRKLIPLIREAATCYAEQESCEALTVASLKEAIRPMVREQLFFEYGQAFEVLTKNHGTFEAFQASSNYVSFQALLQSEQDAGIELMIEGKLLVVDEELDEELMRLITSTVEAKEAHDEVDDKPVTQEELRARRLDFFGSNSNQSNTNQDDTASSLSKDS